VDWEGADVQLGTKGLGRQTVFRRGRVKEGGDVDMKELKVQFKPLTIVVPPEREALYEKLKAHMAVVDEILSDPSAPRKLKLRALAVEAKLAQALWGVLKEVEDEEIHAAIAELRQKMDQLKPKGDARRRRGF
jgi:hypothetical protein